MKLIKPTEKNKLAREKATQNKTTDVTSRDEKVNYRKGSSRVSYKKRSIKLNLKKLSKNRCICVFSNSAETEYYRILWANIKRHSIKHDWKTIMITSAYTGEGKTLTAINLAITVAKEFGQTTLLVDCDLKRQSIHRYMGYRSEKGIVNYLVDDCPIYDLVVWPGINKLYLISGGRPVINSAELLGSPKMKSFVDKLNKINGGGYLIFDAPPIIGWADIISFAPLADCILMVVEEGRTSIQDVKNALEVIPNEKFMGYILNRRKMPTNGYYC